MFLVLSHGSCSPPLPFPSPPPSPQSRWVQAGFRLDQQWWAGYVRYQVSHLSFVSWFTNWWPMNQQKKHLLQTWWIVAFLGFLSSPSSTSFTLSHIKFFSLYSFHDYFFSWNFFWFLKWPLKCPQGFTPLYEEQAPELCEVKEILHLSLLQDATEISRWRSADFRSTNSFQSMDPLLTHDLNQKSRNQMISQSQEG